MFCKGKSKNHFIIILFIGVISFVFGTLYYRILPDEAHNLSMLSGMFSGFGGAFIAVGLINLVRLKVTSPEKLRRKENEKNDERNVQVLRAAYTTAEVGAIILFSVMTFVFVWLDYKVPAFICVGALYVNAAIFLISYHIYNKRM